MKIQKQKMNIQKGFVVLFAMLVSSIILLISAGIYNIVQKQVVLSSYARESQRAFYAADAAIDCALFYDISNRIEKSAFPVGVTNFPSTKISCAGKEVKVSFLSKASKSRAADDFNYLFAFRYAGQQDISFSGLSEPFYLGTGCAYVLVEKKQNTAGLIETRLTAAGFNVCREGSTAGVFEIPDFNDPTLLERRLSVSYTYNVPVATASPQP